MRTSVMPLGLDDHGGEIGVRSQGCCRVGIRMETAGRLPGIEVGPEAQLGEWTTTRVAGLAPPLRLTPLASPQRLDVAAPHWLAVAVLLPLPPWL